MNVPKKYVQSIARMINPPPLAVELGLSHGLELSVKAHDYPLGEMGECFKNATMGAYEHGLLYCEGWATSPALKGLALEHAWCVDPQDMSVIDLTWNYPDAEYFGVILHMHDVAKLTIEQQVYGIFGNLFRQRMTVQKVREWLPSIVWQRAGVN